MVGRKRSINWPDYHNRARNYCHKYQVVAREDGSIPFPPGVNGLAQYKSWMALHHLRKRLRKRETGECENCKLPAIKPTLFCPLHRASNTGRAGKHQATLKTRTWLLDQQQQLCPICKKPVGLWESLDHDHASGRHRAIVHQQCNMAIGWIEKLSDKEIQAVLVHIGRI